MGIIMVVTAVLLTHIERKAEAARNPAMSAGLRVPEALMMARAMRRWRFERSIARAMKIPPRKRNTTGLANGPAAVWTLQMPAAGNRTSGSRAVTANGSTSEIQSAAMSAPAPRVRQPAGERPSGFSERRVKMKNASPAAAMVRLRMAAAIGGTQETPLNQPGDWGFKQVLICLTSV